MEWIDVKNKPTHKTEILISRSYGTGYAVDYGYYDKEKDTFYNKDNQSLYNVECWKYTEEQIIKNNLKYFWE